MALGKKKKDEALPIDPLAGEVSDDYNELVSENPPVGSAGVGSKYANYEPTDEEIEAIKSTYLPARRMRRLGNRLLHLDKMRLFLVLSCLLVAILFIMAMFQEKMGNFTINLDRLELFRKGVAISADGEFTQPTARLAADPIHDATNITFTDIPTNVDEIEGGHNGENYLAYTYFIRNGGKEDVDYIARVNLTAASKGAEEAVRVIVWHNGESVVYAEPAKDGNPEPGCTNFESHNVVCSFHEKDFLVGNVNKYTIVIYMEGEDPECIDDIVGGSVEFSMSVSADDNVDTTLFQKWIQDIKDTLTGNKPINASGTESPTPGFQNYENVTWETRRNQ